MKNSLWGMRLCGSEPWAGGGFIATATAAAAHTGENETPNTMCTNNTNTNTNTGERNNKIILNQQIIKIILNQQITGSLSSIDQSIFMTLPRVGGVTPVTEKKRF